MYKSYGQRKQYGYGDQANKALYDIRDNVESQARRLNTLTRAIRELSEGIKVIEDVLRESDTVTRNYAEWKHPLAHAGDSKEPIQVLRDSDPESKEEGICRSKRQSRRRLDDLHDKRQTPHGKTPKSRTSFDVSPPRRKDSNTSIPEDDKK